MIVILEYEHFMGERGDFMGGTGERITNIDLTFSTLTSAQGYKTPYLQAYIN